MAEESDSPHINFIRLFRAPLYSRRRRNSKRFGIRAFEWTRPVATQFPFETGYFSGALPPKTLLSSSAAQSRASRALFLSAITSETAASMVSEICGVSGEVSIMLRATERDC